VDSALGAELLKTRKRWLPYGLFALAVLGAVIIVFPAGYVEWHQSENSDPEVATTAFHTFVFPYSLAALMDSGQFWGSMLVGILAGSVVATEYRWGTVRQVLIRGQPRMQYLALKLAAIIIVSSLMLLTALAIGVALSLYATNLADKPITLDVRDGPSWPEIGLMVLRAAWCIVPYGMLAVMLAILSRSSVTAVTGIIVFLFGEAVVIALLDTLGGIGGTLRDVSIGENVKALVAANKIGLSDYNAMSPREQLNPFDAANPNWAALVLGLHTAVYALVSFAVFRRRDVTG